MQVEQEAEEGDAAYDANYDNRNHHFPSRQLRLFAGVFEFGIDARLLRLAGEKPREQKPAGAGGQRIAVVVLVVIHAGDF